MQRSTMFVALAAVAAIGFADAQTTFTAPQGDAGQARGPRHKSRSPPVVSPIPGFGDPIAGLTATQLADFAEGREAFAEEDDAASGLGPAFNNVSCVACHSVRVREARAHCS